MELSLGMQDLKHSDLGPLRCHQPDELTFKAEPDIWSWFESLLSFVQTSCPVMSYLVGSFLQFKTRYTRDTQQGSVT